MVDYKIAERTLCRWREVFGDRLAVEVQLQSHECNESCAGNSAYRASRKTSRALGDLSGANATSITTAGSCTTFSPRCVTIRPIDDALRARTAASNGEWRLASPVRNGRALEGREAGLEESERIAAECDFSLAWVRPPLPKFPVPAGYNDDTFLREKVFEGARERLGEVDGRSRCTAGSRAAGHRHLVSPDFFW